MSEKLTRWVLDHLAAWCVLFRRRERAIAYYEQILARNPRDVLALASIGFNFAQLDRKREALAMFERVVAFKHDDAEAHFNRGFLLQELNDHDAALEAFRQALAINGDHDRALYGVALSLIRARRLEEAVAPLRKNTRLQPMSPFGWYQLARVYHELGRLDEAQKVLDHLATFEPKVARQLERETSLRAAPLA